MWCDSFELCLNMRKDKARREMEILLVLHRKKSSSDEKPSESMRTFITCQTQGMITCCFSIFLNEAFTFQYAEFNMLESNPGVYFTSVWFVWEHSNHMQVKTNRFQTNFQRIQLQWIDSESTQLAEVFKHAAEKMMCNRDTTVVMNSWLWGVFSVVY